MKQSKIIVLLCMLFITPFVVSADSFGISPPTTTLYLLPGQEEVVEIQLSRDITQGNSVFKISTDSEIEDHKNLITLEQDEVIIPEGEINTTINATINTGNLVVGDSAEAKAVFTLDVEQTAYESTVTLALPSVMKINVVDEAGLAKIEKEQEEELERARIINEKVNGHLSKKSTPSMVADFARKNKIYLIGLSAALVLMVMAIKLITKKPKK